VKIKRFSPNTQKQRRTNIFIPSVPSIDMTQKEYFSEKGGATRYGRELEQMEFCNAEERSDEASQNSGAY
jgi:hypothetical protein